MHRKTCLISILLKLFHSDIQDGHLEILKATSPLETHVGSCVDPGGGGGGGGGRPTPEKSQK